MRVAVLDDYQRAFVDDPSIQRLRERVRVDVYTERIEDPRQLRGYGALIAVRERTRFDATFFKALPGLRLIAQTGNHAYHIDLKAATEAGVLVALAPSRSATSTAELTIGLIIAALRRLPQTDRAIRRGEWPLAVGRTLRGKRLGILGMGRVGSEVARPGASLRGPVVSLGTHTNP